MSPIASRWRPRARTAAVLAAALLLAAVALVLHGFDEWLRRTAEHALQARLVPRVELAGPVEWSLRPAPAVTLRGLALHAPSGGPVAQVREVVVRLVAGELWHGQIEVDEIRVAGIDLALPRDAGGWHAERWLKPGTGAGSGAAPDIRRVVVEDAHLRVVGEPASTVSVLHLEAGPIAFGAGGNLTFAVRAAGGDTSAELAGTARFRLEQDRFEAQEIDFTAHGRSGAWRLSDARVVLDAVRWRTDGGLRFGRSQVSGSVAGSPGALRFDAAIDEIARDGTGWHGRALTLAVTSAPPAAPRSVELAGDIEYRSADARALVLTVARGHARLPHPSGSGAPLVLSFAGRASFDPARGVADGTLAGGFDDTRFDAAWQLVPANAAPLALVASLDRIDLDRYLPPPATKTAPADLAAWRDWPVSAELRIGRMKMGGFESEDARLRLSGPAAIMDAR